MCTQVWSPHTVCCVRIEDGVGKRFLQYVSLIGELWKLLFFSSNQVVFCQRFLCYIALKLERKTCLFHTMTQCIRRSKHPQSRLYKTNLLMLYKVKVAVRSEILAKATKLM